MNGSSFCVTAFNIEGANYCAWTVHEYTEDKVHVHHGPYMASSEQEGFQLAHELINKIKSKGKS